MTNKIQKNDDSLGQICRNENYKHSGRNIDGMMYCFANSGCKYLVKTSEENFCGFYHQRLWRNQKPFEERFKNLKLGFLEIYVGRLESNFKNLDKDQIKKYRLASKILKRRKKKAEDNRERNSKWRNESKNLYSGQLNYAMRNFSVRRHPIKKSRKTQNNFINKN